MLGGFNPAENISQISSFPQIGMKIKHSLKPLKLGCEQTLLEIVLYQEKHSENPFFQGDSSRKPFYPRSLEVTFTTFERVTCPLVY